MAPTNNILLTLAVFLACSLCFQTALSQNTVPQCVFTDMSQVNATVEQCFSHVSGMQRFVEDIINGRSVDQSTIFEVDTQFCQNTRQGAESLICFQNKAIDCVPVPEMRQELHDLLPDQSKWEKAYNYLCENRDKIQTDCLGPAAEVNFQSCFTNEVDKIFRDFNPKDSKAIGDAVCGVSNTMGSCMSKHRGNCSQEFVGIERRMMEILMPCNRAIQAGATVLLVVVSLFLSIFNKRV